MKDFKELRYVWEGYKDIFSFIIRRRPEFKIFYERLVDELESYKLNLKDWTEKAYHTIEKIINYIDECLKLVSNFDNNIDKLLFYLMVTRETYPIWNGWWTLLDGLFFEGVLEEFAEKFLKEIEIKYNISPVEIMTILDRRPREIANVVIDESDKRRIQWFAKLYEDYKKAQEDFNKLMIKKIHPVVSKLFDELKATFLVVSKCSSVDDWPPKMIEEIEEWVDKHVYNLEK